MAAAVVHWPPTALASPSMRTGSTIAGRLEPSGIVSASSPSKAALNLIVSVVPVELFDSWIAARRVHLPPAVKQPATPTLLSGSSSVLSTVYSAASAAAGTASRQP